MQSMKLIFGCCFVGVSVAAATQAAETRGGDVSAGFAYANQVCAECHAIRRGERTSPNERAPAFQMIAEAHGMSEMALRVWFQTAHPSMPNLVIRDKTADDLVVYIISLNKRS